MTENEMLKIAVHCLGVQAEQEVCEECDVYGNCHTDCKDVAVVAIKALEEIQQYQEIGTVEECREAVEKQKPKKRIYPKTALERYYHAPECPNCKEEWQEKEDDIMMDAVKYLKERKRMCDSYNNMCEGCGFGKVPKCDRTEEDNPEKAVEIVEKWSAEHPIKTRQSELLKAFPNAEIENGVAVACPKTLDKNVECETLSSCVDCTRKYWLAEIE